LMSVQKFLAVAGALAVLGTIGCSQEPKPKAPASGLPASAAASPAAATKDVWVSQTTGREYRVRQDPSHFYAEWTNMSGAFLAHGAYIRSECKRQGNKWVGESHSHLPCVQGDLPPGQYTNWCDFVTKIEFDEVTPTRITGRGPGVKLLDCQKCQFHETDLKPFVWIPKK
jgi:hypothetical protein